MPAYHVERSVRIAAPESQVRAAVEDFNEWPKWSPWLCMEPSAKVTVYGTPGRSDHGYDWDGELVGAGDMKIASLEEDRLKMDLHFLRPFKSMAKVMLVIKSLGESDTEVTWHMDGKLPFFMFFLLGMMKTMIGRDYERGLKMLKEYVEAGSVKSKVEVVGVVDVLQSHYVGVSAHCTMNQIGESMSATISAANKIATDHQLSVAGPPGAVYHKFDMKVAACDYTAIVQIDQPTEIEGVTTGSIGPCKALKVVHTGKYEHLGNAWSAAMSCQRYKKLKPLKSQSPFELYLNDPEETPEEELVTEILIPLRG